MRLPTFLQTISYPELRYLFDNMMKALYKEKGAQFRIELLEIPYSDDKVRPEHAVLNRVTLPITDKFREEFYPPNGWGCRCTGKVGHASAPDLA